MDPNGVFLHSPVGYWLFWPEQGAFYSPFPKQGFSNFVSHIFQVKMTKVATHKSQLKICNNDNRSGTWFDSIILFTISFHHVLCYTACAHTATNRLSDFSWNFPGFATSSSSLPTLDSYLWGHLSTKSSSYLNWSHFQVKMSPLF